MKTAIQSLLQIRTFKAILPAFAVGSALTMAHAAVQLVSPSNLPGTAPAGGDGSSGLPILSADGRYVLFASTANNLVLTNNNGFVLPQRMNVFLRDRTAGTTTLVSANAAGTGGGNGDSFPTGFSTNGQFALFESAASDLVANDTNSLNDVFVRDLVHGSTTLVSVGTNGNSGSGTSRNSVMTLDGRYVAFVSTATSLIAAGDTNGIADVFVRDLQAGKTMLVSIGALSTNSPVVGSSESPEITPDGRYVAYFSTATNLVPGVGTPGEVYVRDLLAAKTLWVSTNARAIFQSVFGSSNTLACNLSLSADGQFIAFEVYSNVSGAIPSPGIVLRYQLQTGLTDTICTNGSVPGLSPESIHNLAMTPDGQSVAFVANLNPVSTTNSAIYRWDASTGTNTLVSMDFSNPATPANGIFDSPVISSDGQWIAYISSATDLVTNPLAGGFHAYLCNVPARTTRLLDADTNGFGVGVNFATTPALSADGSVAVFESANLLNDNRHLTYDVFAYDSTANTTGLISGHHPALLSRTPDGITSFTAFSASADGRYVAFYSDADNIVPNDTNGYPDVFVRDLVLGTTILVSVDSNGVAPAHGLSTEPAISGNGRFVAFTSSADNLVPGVTNNGQNVFIRDLQAGTTVLVSINTDGVHSGNGDSFSPQISQDGRYVVFHSKANNLAAGSFGNGIENLFCRDLQAGTNYALTAASSGLGVASAAMTPDGQSIAFIGTAPGTAGAKLYVWNTSSAARTYTNNAISASFFPLVPTTVAISTNGQKVAYLANSPLHLYAADTVANTVVTIDNTGTFQSHSGLHLSDDGRYLVYAVGVSGSTNQSVNLYDLQAGTNLLVSQNFTTLAAANAGSDLPNISADGRFVAYRSFATNLAALDANNVADLFLFDTASNVTYLVSLNAAGISSASDRSLNPVFSRDGQTLLFQSWGSDLAGSDFNNGSDLFAFNLAALPGGAGTINSASVFYAQFSLAGGYGQSGLTPLVTWPMAAGQTYQVQYKNDLNDPAWQNLPGNSFFIGATGYAPDAAPAADKRFYRIILNP